MNIHMRKSAILSLLTGIFLYCFFLLALPNQNALAMGGPALNVSGGDIAEINGAYTDNNIEQANGKAFYWGPGGGPYIDYAGGQWELLYSYQIRYRSSATNSSNAALPPTGGWVRADGSTDADFVVSYGPSMGFASSTATVNEVDGSVSLRVNISNFSYTSMLYYTCSDGTAVSGSDYSGGGSIQLYGSETFVYIPISIINDSDYEGNETFTVILSGQAGAPITGATCTVTIVSDDPQAYVSVASGTITAAESSGTVSIPISLSTAVASDVTVQYTTDNGTAAAGSDYTQTKGTLTISAGQTTGSISVPILNDSVYEGSETFTLTLSSPTSSALGSAKVSTVTLTDDEAQPTLNFDSAAVTIGENGATASLTVVLSASCQNTVTVQYSTANGSAVSGSDYTAKNGTLTIDASGTGTIVVNVLDDAVYEGSETFTVTLDSPTVAALGTSKTATITLTDNDTMPQIAFASSTLTVNENTGTADLAITLTGQSQLDTTVQYTTHNVTALAGSDYTGKSETFTIPGGNSTGTIQIPIIDDSVYEGANEAFTVTLSSPANATLGAGTFTVTITDNETLPQASFTSGTFTQSENASQAELTVSLTCASQSDITIAYTTQDDTAIAGSDYTASSGTLTIPAYSTSGTIQVPLINDNVYEGSESFTAVLSSPAGATLGTSSATMTIADDEPVPTAGFTPAAVTVSENGVQATLTVTLSGLSAADCSVDYETADGTAKTGSDYTSTSGKLTIHAGDSSATVTVPILDNSVYESNETFTVILSAPSGAVLGEKTATVTINDNEAAPQLSFDPAILTLDEGTATAELTVKLSGETQEDVTAVYTTADGTAKGGSDFTAKTGTLTIPAGFTSGTVQIAIKEDSLYESGEDFTVELSSPVGAVLGTGTATVRITDNETMPVISFDPAVLTKNENAATATLTLSLSGMSQADVTVQYTTQDGTAMAGSDYTAASGTLTIAGGTVSTTAVISLMDDSIYEGSESFTVLLSAPIGATLGVDTATVNLNDTESMPVLSFNPHTLTLAENDSTAALIVTLSGISQADTTVQYSTQDGTAKAGYDFTATSGTLTVPAGSTSATVDIPLLDDILYEGSESFTAILSDPVGATLGTKTATVTLTDTETKPQIGFDPAFVTQIENGGKATLTVTLSGASQADVTVDYVTAGGTAKVALDYTATSGTLTIPGGSTSGQIEIPLNDDLLYEGDEAFRVTLSAPTGATLGTDEATVTIQDNEGMPEIGFTQNVFQKEESTGKVSLTVSLTCASQTDVQADYATSDLTAAAGSDYAAKTGTLVIPAGETSGTVEITLKEDSVYEGNETFAVTLSGSAGATLAMHNATVEITDNESMPQISFDPVSLTLDESTGKALLNVKLSGKAQADTTVSYATLNNTAKEGFDFSAASGILTIPAGSTAGTIEIAILDDIMYETNEDFTLILINPAGAVLGVSSATVSITDNDTMPSVGFETPLVHVNEAEAQALVTVRLDAVSGVDTAVGYTTVDDTAISGMDYTVQTGTAVIPAGSLTGIIPIPLLPDAVYEGSEAFTVKLSAPSGAALSADTLSVVLDDSLSEPALSIAPVTIRESVGEASLTVSLSHLSSKDITVAYATSDKTAKAGSDYRSASGTLIIPAMTLTGSIKVRILNDDVYESTETLKITLSIPTGATIGTDQALITINDNDPKPTVTPTASPTPSPSATPVPSLAPTATKAQANATPTAAPTATPSPTPASTSTPLPVATINPGTVYVDVQEKAIATQEKTDAGNGQQETATVVHVDEEFFNRTVAYAKEIAKDTGADVIVRFPDIVLPDEDTTMRLNLLSNQVQSVANEGMGVSVKMENVTFAVPSSVLSQAAEDSDNISLECRKAQDEAQPYFKIDSGNGALIGQAYQYTLAVTRKNGDTGYVDQFNSPVTIIVQLTPEEAAAIADISKVAMRYVNPVTGKTELLPSVYDPVTMTLTFNTTYFAEAAEE